MMFLPNVVIASHFADFIKLITADEPTAPVAPTTTALYIMIPELIIVINYSDSISLGNKI